LSNDEITAIVARVEPQTYAA